MIISRSTSRFGIHAAAASLFFASQALAGYVYELAQSDFKNGKPSDSSSVQIMVDDGNIRMSGFGDEKGEMIYRGDEGAMIILDHKRKSYTQLDKQTVDDMAAQIQGAMAQMEEQLANMPPAQRKMMEGMMKKRMPQLGGEKLELTVSRTGEMDTIAGYKAERVDVSTSEGKQRELWVAPWSELEGSKEISESFTGMAKMFEGMMDAFSQGPFADMMKNQMQSNWLDQIQNLGGFPVMTREFDAAGEVTSETRLSGIDEKDIAESEFEAPEGYKRKKIGK